MMTFDLNKTQDRAHFARTLAGFQLHGVEYTLTYDGGYAYVTPWGAHKPK